MSEKSFLPAFFYILLSLFSPQLNSFSPPLVATFFLLFVIQKTMSYLKKEDVNEMYDAGFFLGISSFCYMPILVLTLAFLLTLLFFTRSNGKAYLLFFLGTLFPWLVLGVIYLWNGGLPEIFSIFLHHYFTIRYDYLAWDELTYSGLIPIGIFLVGLFYSLSGRAREINYQSICRRFFLVLLVGNVLAFLISPTRSIADLHPFLPGLAFFFSYYFLQIKKPSVPNLLISSALAVMIFLQYAQLHGGLWATQRQKACATLPPENPLLSGKKIWVVGNDYLPYLQGSSATKYLNWRVSQDDFGKLNNFNSLEHIRENVESAQPEVIVDKLHVLPEVFKRIPSLSKHYVLLTPDMYGYRK